jgi:nitrilase
MCRGGSAIVGPLGDYIKEPVWGREEMMIADLNLKEIAASRFDFDAVGHYARPDVFHLTVNETKRDQVTWENKKEANR